MKTLVLNNLLWNCSISFRELVKVMILAAAMEIAAIFHQMPISERMNTAAYRMLRKTANLMADSAPNLARNEWIPLARSLSTSINAYAISNAVIHNMTPNDIRNI